MMYANERAPGLCEELEAAVAAVHHILPEGARPTLGLILGSGLGAWADGLKDAVTVDYSDIPHPLRSTVVKPRGPPGRRGASKAIDGERRSVRVSYYKVVSTPTKATSLRARPFPRGCWARSVVACSCSRTQPAASTPRSHPGRSSSCAIT